MSEKTIELPLPIGSPTRSKIKGKIGKHSIIFPSKWVLDIIVIERSKVLHLPFYPKSLLGIAYYQSKLVPFVYLEKGPLKTNPPLTLSNNVMGVRLGPKAGELNGVAVIIEQLLGDAPNQACDSHIEFDLSDLSPQIWSPILGQIRSS